ncbi:30S ribosomal protein S4 [Candidatus Wolfebacteria bacterium]|nr:30S ribosomal protein S4 [Candidatus Wolfebacteria bacterium]
MPTIRPKEKKERSLGVKLFLKAERCNSPKCVMVRRAYRPGIHGKKRRRTPSEYGQQLMEKQRIKTSYGLREAQFSKIVYKAFSKGGGIGETILDILERQLFNVVFRLGFASSRFIARQFVSHGHFLVNGKKVSISSYAVRVGDVISIKPASKQLLIFKDLSDNIKKYEPPHWLAVDKEKLEGRIKSLPRDIETGFDINLIIDYYSK